VLYWVKLTSKIWVSILDVLFPSICLGCRTHLDERYKSALLCEDCLEKIPIYKTVFRTEKGLLLFAVTSYADKTAKELVHYFKYKSFLAAQKPIRELVLKYLNNFQDNRMNSPALVVPIPLHKSRFKERGFNQAEILAEIIGGCLNLPVETRLLTKIKRTKDQTKLKDYDERKRNVRNSFVLHTEVLEPLKQSGIEKIILVDDVYTSGATIHEAVKLLHRAGLKDITVFVFAKAGQ